MIKKVLILLFLPILISGSPAQENNPPKRFKSYSTTSLFIDSVRMADAKRERDASLKKRQWAESVHELGDALGK